MQSHISPKGATSPFPLFSEHRRVRLSLLVLSRGPCLHGSLPRKALSAFWAGVNVPGRQAWSGGLSCCLRSQHPPLDHLLESRLLLLQSSSVLMHSGR